MYIVYEYLNVILYTFISFQINGTSVTKEKPSVVKKLLKPNKGVLRLVVEREEEPIHTHYLTSDVPPPGK